MSICPTHFEPILVLVDLPKRPHFGKIMKRNLGLYTAGLTLTYSSACDMERKGIIFYQPMKLNKNTLTTFLSRSDKQFIEEKWNTVCTQSVYKLLTQDRKWRYNWHSYASNLCMLDSSQMLTYYFKPILTFKQNYLQYDPWIKTRALLASTQNKC